MMYIHENKNINEHFNWCWGLHYLSGGICGMNNEKESWSRPIFWWWCPRRRCLWQFHPETPWDWRPCSRDHITRWFSHTSACPTGWLCSHCILNKEICTTLYTIWELVLTCKQQSSRNTEVNCIDAEQDCFFLIAGNLCISSQVK